MILGIDPSLVCSGLCVIDNNKNNKLIYFEKIETKPKQNNRLFYIISKIQDVINNYNISVIKIEAGYTISKKEKVHQRGNQKSIIQLAELRGCIKYISQLNNIKLYEYEPCSVKKYISGKGNCEKKDIYLSLYKLYKDDDKFLTIGDFSDLHNKNKTDDIYDAIAISLMPDK